MSTPAASSAMLPAAADAPVANRPYIVLCIMLATIMQALDTTIANVALPHMQGTLNATQEQVSWVLTSYIVAAAIMTPPTGFLAARLGRKRLFIVSITGFTIASILCGAAGSLPAMVIFRLLQGVCGACLVPLSQAVLLDIFPRHQHGKAMAMWGVGVMLGPILGPTLGGWITEYYSWRWVFYINVPVGILAIAGILAFMPETARDAKRRLDITGFALLSLAVGTFQLMLDRGQTLDWFSSPEIVIEAVVAGLCLYLFVVHMFTAEKPFLEPGLFRDRNFVIGLFFIFIVGVLILAVMALLPPYMQGVMGYPVLLTGLLLAPRGIGTMVAMMAVGRLIGRVDERLLIFAGIMLVTLSLWEMTLFTDSVPPALLIRTGIIQGLGMGFVFVPLSTLTYATLAPHYRGEATALFSLIRNIGSSIGVSVMIALLAHSMQVSHADLAAHVTPFGNSAGFLQGLSDAAGLPADGGRTALRLLDAEINRQAATIGYLNDFRAIMFINLLTLPLLLLIRRPPPHRITPGEAAAAIE